MRSLLWYGRLVYDFAFLAPWLGLCVVYIISDVSVYFNIFAGTVSAAKLIWPADVCEAGYSACFLLNVSNFTWYRIFVICSKKMFTILARCVMIP